MPIQVKCPKCQAVHTVADNMAGKRAKCRCGGVIAIPAAPGTPAPTSAAPAQARPQAAPPAGGGFGQLSADEMDDLFGGGEQSTSEEAAQQQSSVPANLVGASEQPKQVEQPEGPQPVTGKDRRIAIMGIIAGVMAIPAGTVLPLLVLFLWIPLKLPPGEPAQWVLTVMRLYWACLWAGGELMATSAIGVIAFSIGELKGSLPTSDSVYKLGAFGALTLIAGIVISGFLTDILAYDASVQAAQRAIDDLEGSGGLGSADEEVDYGPLLLWLLIRFAITIGILPFACFVPAFMLYVCRAHRPIKPKTEEL